MLTSHIPIHTSVDLISWDRGIPLACPPRHFRGHPLLRTFSERTGCLCNPRASDLPPCHSGEPARPWVNPDPQLRCALPAPAGPSIASCTPPARRTARLSWGACPGPLSHEALTPHASHSLRGSLLGSHPRTSARFQVQGRMKPAPGAEPVPTGPRALGSRPGETLPISAAGRGAPRPPLWYSHCHTRQPSSASLFKT